MPGENFALTVALGLIGAMFTVLMALLGWLGTRTYNKIDEMSGMINKVISELHDRINGIDRRVVRAETKLGIPEFEDDRRSR